MAHISHRTWEKQDGRQSDAYQVTYYDGAGQRKRRTFRARKSAQRFVENLGTMREEDKASKVTKNSPTFRETSERFLQACEIGRAGGVPLERKTVMEYRNALKLHVVPFLGDYPVTRITTRLMKEFLEHLQTTGPSRRWMEFNLMLAKAVLKHCVYLELIEANPASDLTIRVDKRMKQEVEIHTKEQMRSLLATSDSMTQRSQAIVHTMVYTGLRLSELRGLPCDALDWRRQTIKVYQRADLFGTIGPCKSRHSYRTVQIPTGLATMLKDWVGDRHDGLVFGTESGRPIDHTNIAHRVWRPVQVKAAVPILKPHSARHFFASMLIDSGVGLKSLQSLMGHHDPMFTMRVYGHLFRDEENLSLIRKMFESMEKTLTLKEEED